MIVLHLRQFIRSNYFAIASIILCLLVAILSSGCEQNNGSSSTGGIEVHNESSYEVILQTSWTETPKYDSHITTYVLAPGEDILIEAGSFMTTFYNYEPYNLVEDVNVENDVLIFRNREQN